MHMKRWFAALLLAAASARAETVALTVRIDTKPLPKKESPLQFESVAPVEAKSETLRVTLAPAFIVIAGPESTSILDFDKHLKFDTTGEGATVVSLFSVLGFREREMENRKYLADLLERAGGTASIPLAVSEQNLALLADPPAKGVERRATDDTVRFRWRKINLGEYSTETLPASDAERKAFTQFIRYSVGAHPLMLADLRKAPGIPKRIKLVDNIGGRTEELIIQKLERVADAPYDAPSNARMGLVSHEKWGAVVQRAMALSPEDVRTQAAELARAADAAFGENRLVDAFLLYLESFLMSGDISDGFRRNQSTLNADASVKRLAKAINPKSAEEARASLETLGEVRKTHPDRAEVLRIFEGNIRNNLGETDAAYEHLHAVLTARPAIAGVWHDLGGMFLNGYAADAAWDCWATLRHLAPQHGMSKEIHEREAKMMELYPEYF